MTVLDSTPAAPTTGPSLRLLAGVAGGQAVSLAEHRRRHGLRRPAGLDRLITDTAAVGLLGRGGAAFPVTRKLAGITPGRNVRVVVNGSEGEPASAKDRTLLRLAPHLVLDGALAVADAYGTDHLTVVTSDARGATAVHAAIAERDDAARVRVERAGPGFVSGEVRAVSRLLSGGPAVPPGRRILPTVHGVDGAPTFASNAETFAQVGALVALGAQRFAETGSPREPGTTLLTLLGDVPAAGVLEVPTLMPLRSLLPGSDQDADDRPVLIGGYHGSWHRTVPDVEVSRPALAEAGLPLNAGVVARLPHSTCSLGEVARVTRWLAGESAGQCGPCRFGLPAVADDVEALVRGEDVLARLRPRVGLLPGRGACAHPDGAARFVASALTALADEVAVHLAHGTCGRPVQGVLPVPAEGSHR